MNNLVWHSSLATPLASAAPFVLYVLEDVDWLVDADGRPLGEQRAPRQPLGLVTDLQSCPYSGSRHHHRFPMNVSALRQIAGDWMGVLQDLSLLRREYLLRAKRDAVTIRDLWRLATAARLLPSYLYFSQRVRDREVPTSVSALYKTVVGIVALVESMLGVLRGTFSVPLIEGDIDTLVRFADDSGLLIGGRQVCSAPAKMMRDALATLSFGAAPSVRSSSALCALNFDDFFLYVDVICLSIARRANFSRGMLECTERLSRLHGLEGTSAIGVAGPLGGVEQSWARQNPENRSLMRERLCALVESSPSACQTTGSFAHVLGIPGLDPSAHARAKSHVVKALRASLPEASIGPAADVAVESAWAELNLVRATATATATLVRLLSAEQEVVPLDPQDVSRLFRATPATILSSLCSVEIPSASALFLDA